MLIAAGIALVSVGVVADTVPTVSNPENFFLGQAPRSPANGAETATATAAVEKPQAVNGALYAVIAPTYNGSGGTSSFIRLFNGGAATATFSVTVQGSPSGNTYGVGNLQVPTRAALQYSMADILTAANAGPLAGADTSYSLYLQSAESTAGFQHVIFNTTNLFFENVSACTYLLNQTIRSIVNSVVLTSIHTTLFPTYPSQVEIHNYLNSAVNYTVTVIDARTGTIKGAAIVPVEANATRIEPFSFFQNAVGWTPAAGEFHGNIVVTNPNGSPAAVLLGQSITNANIQGARVSMSTACAVNAPVPANSGDGGGFGGGGIVY